MIVFPVSRGKNHISQGQERQSSLIGVPYRQSLYYYTYLLIILEVFSQNIALTLALRNCFGIYFPGVI